MFERFTDDARQVVALAGQIARARGDRAIEVVHVFAGLAAVGESTVIAAGLTRERIEQLWDTVPVGTSVADGLDAEALAGIGIDVEAVRRATDHSFGRGPLDRIRRRQIRPSSGHLPFSANAKEAVQLSLQHAVSMRCRDLAPSHVLLGLLDVDDHDLLAVLDAADVTTESLRAGTLEFLAVKATPADHDRHTVRAGFDHVSLQVADLDAATTFYAATLAPLDVRELVRHDDAVGFGSERPFFWLGKASTDGAAREVHLAFTAPDRETVYAFRDAAVALGAEVLHEPRLFRDYHPSYFAAFIRDPDGNNVEAVCHLPAPG